MVQEFETKMMQQYMEIKSQYSDCILFFRLGDFYEMFLDDAKLGANILGITLTSRTRGKDGKIPMAGVPYHAVDTYLNKLVKSGYKVAICEQLSEPGQGDLVERGVVRIVTPGTILDDKHLDKKENNFIAAVIISKDSYAAALCDITTASFLVIENKPSTDLQNLASDLTKFQLGEIILPKEMYENTKHLAFLHNTFKTNIYHFTPEDYWDTNKARKHVRNHFRVKSLQAYGLAEDETTVRAMALLLKYLEYTQKEKVKHISTASRIDNENFLQMDRSTIINLEILKTLRDNEKHGSLLSVIDHTQTPMGGRLLKQWLLKPLVEKESIEEKQDLVGYFFKNTQIKNLFADMLSAIGDTERTLSRVALGIVNGRDLVSIKNDLANSLKVKNELEDINVPLALKLSEKINPKIKEIVQRIENTIVEEPPYDIKDGKVIRRGIHKRLDELRDIMENSQDFLRKLEATERDKTKIPTLKVRFNKVFGFYIEISKSHTKNAPDNYFRKQTLVNAERFITQELKEHEDLILTAEEEIKKLELELFMQCTDFVTQRLKYIQEAAHAIAQADCIVGFATCAHENDYVRPKITKDKRTVFKNARHPVVEKLLDEGSFVPNDAFIDGEAKHMMLVTGPNMAGKSVFIRQIALLTLLAQAGSFIPAQEAEIGITDKIFVRSGAADVITSGLSTFMVEMVETANILNNATDKSLVILDEIGRGTSTYDGISLAWSIAEYLITDIKPRTLFATHYHELQELEEKFPERVQNLQVAVDHSQGSPIFLHKVIGGSAEHSYGIHVAKLAGLPVNVIKNAEEMLIMLENKNNGNN